VLERQPDRVVVRVHGLDDGSGVASAGPPAVTFWHSCAN